MATALRVHVGDGRWRWDSESPGPHITEPYLIYHEFGWKVYKFIALGWKIYHEFGWKYYVTCAALPLSLVLLVEGHLAARHENKLMMFTFISGCAGAMIYFVYKLFKVLKYRDTLDYVLVWKTLTVFFLRNFGRGLKDAFHPTMTGHRNLKPTTLRTDSRKRETKISGDRSDEGRFEGRY
ncbi:hypothetical protein B0H14DRAFT_2624583 [Mycena olivaceomarginata]|nr:hypothetical protein B0H14DRAFT_2624583 [Mycena olivaceomarginata]